MNKQTNQKLFLIFCHLGKTGGTTMHYILSNNLPLYFALNSEKKFGNHRAFDEKALKKLLNISQKTISGIGGHNLFPHFDYANLLEEHNFSPFMFTFFRDPIKRYISHLNHGIVNMGLDWDFDYFISRKDYYNVQTRSIAGVQDAEIAIEILKNKFSFVGLIERFDESLLLMKDKFPGEINMHYEKQNVIEGLKKKYTMSNLSTNQLEKIRELNKEDIKLYDFVKDVYYPSLKNNYRGDLQNDLIEFKIINEKYKFNSSKKILHKMKNQVAKFLIQPVSLR